MDSNEKRLVRIKDVLNCKRDKNLADRLESHPPNITRWKKHGFSPSTANLLDALLDDHDDLQATITTLLMRIRTEHGSDGLSVLCDIERFIEDQKRGSRSKKKTEAYDTVLQHIKTLKERR